MSIIPFFRNRQAEGEPDWRQAARVIDRHDPTIDDLVSDVDGAQDRLGRDIRSVAESALNLTRCRERLARMIEDKGIGVTCRPDVLSDDKIAELIELAMRELRRVSEAEDRLSAEAQGSE